jgi:glycosyltransferase involved in cell wall biosynthesis
MTNKPHVSIGMPVYNGERYIKETLDSWLSQTFKDFELVISDNASTDATEEMCRAYAAKDPRIRYYRNVHNLGASPNHNRVFELSTGGYFRWAAHDDTCAPDYLEKCVEVLDRDPSIVLCHTRTIRRNQDGVVLSNPDQQKFDQIIEKQNQSSSPHERFNAIINIHHGCYQAFAVVRSDVFRLTKGLGPFTSSDRILLARLALLGRFYQIPEFLFFSKAHLEQSIRTFPGRLERATWFDPQNKGKILFPQWRLFYEYLRAIREARLSLRERLLCYLHLARWVTKGRNLSWFVKDVVMATIVAVQILLRPLRPVALK